MSEIKEQNTIVLNGFSSPLKQLYPDYGQILKINNEIFHSVIHYVLSNLLSTPLNRLILKRFRGKKELTLSEVNKLLKMKMKLDPKLADDYNSARGDTEAFKQFTTNFKFLEDYNRTIYALYSRMAYDEIRNSEKRNFDEFLELYISQLDEPRRNRFFEVLKGTGDRYIYQETATPTIFSLSDIVFDESKTKIVSYRGENYLGISLMRLRERYLYEEKRALAEKKKQEFLVKIYEIEFVKDYLLKLFKSGTNNLNSFIGKTTNIIYNSIKIPTTNLEISEKFYTTYLTNMEYKNFIDKAIAEPHYLVSYIRETYINDFNEGLTNLRKTIVFNIIVKKLLNIRPTINTIITINRGGDKLIDVKDDLSQYISENKLSQLKYLKDLFYSNWKGDVHDPSIFTDNTFTEIKSELDKLPSLATIEDMRQIRIPLELKEEESSSSSSSSSTSLHGQLRFALNSGVPLPTIEEDLELVAISTEKFLNLNTVEEFYLLSPNSIKFSAVPLVVINLNKFSSSLSYLLTKRIAEAGILSFFKYKNFMNSPIFSEIYNMRTQQPEKRKLDSLTIAYKLLLNITTNPNAGLPGICLMLQGDRLAIRCPECGSSGRIQSGFPGLEDGCRQPAREPAGASQQCCTIGCSGGCAGTRS